LAPSSSLGVPREPVQHHIDVALLLAGNAVAANLAIPQLLLSYHHHHVIIASSRRIERAEAREGITLIGVVA
jgi:hypothetical protein